MKKQILAFTITLFVAGTFTTTAQTDRAIKNGVSLSFSLGFPSSDYAFPEGFIYGDQYPVIFGLQVSSRWYIEPQEKWGVAVMVNFLDANFGYKSGPNDNYYKATIQSSVLGVGPLGTYKIMDNMAIDLYYNFRPTGIISIIVTDDNILTEGDDFDMGILHSIGFAYRYNVLMVGVEFNFGNANLYEFSDSDFFPNGQSMSSTRLLLGVKF